MSAPLGYAVRSAEPSDARAIAELHARSWRESYRGSFRDEYLDGDLVGERLRVGRERLDRPPAGQLVEVAIDRGELIGFVCAYGDHDARWGSLIDNLHVARVGTHGGAVVRSCRYVWPRPHVLAGPPSG